MSKKPTGAAPGDSEAMLHLCAHGGGATPEASRPNDSNKKRVARVDRRSEQRRKGCTQVHFHGWPPWRRMAESRSYSHRLFWKTVVNHPRALLHAPFRGTGRTMTAFSL